mmetsp:Transcript_9480/g.17757  ORF Transcript_9480/g.17757 Transcript_9480/m.17757 type:complete len:476 (-) Transcript_9480:129-1556(-)
MSQENLDDEWERNEESLKRMQIGAPPPSVQQSSNSNGQIYEEAPKEDDFIDQALSDTLQNPQERMNLLKFENKILHFVKSKERVLDVPPMSNSFHRLCVYRVAQRFLLEHVYNDSMPPADNSAQSFSLIKTSATRIPSPLLIDIPLKEDVSNVKGSGNMPIGVVSGEGQTRGNEKKPVLMKRDTNKHRRQQKKKTDSSKDSSSDKDKAYAEARARIFAGMEEDGSSTSPEPMTTTTSSSEQAGSRKATAVINTSEKKVTYRDRQAEMYDPDFVRRGPQSALSVPGYNNSGMSDQGYYQQQQQQYQYQQQQQYQHQQYQQSSNQQFPPSSMPNNQTYPAGRGDSNYNNHPNMYNQDNSYGYNMYSSRNDGGYMSRQGYNQYNQFPGNAPMSERGLNSSLPPPPPPMPPSGQIGQGAGPGPSQGHVPVSNMRGLYSTSPSPPAPKNTEQNREHDASRGSSGPKQEPVFSSSDFPKLS